MIVSLVNKLFYLFVIFKKKIFYYVCVMVETDHREQFIRLYIVYEKKINILFNYGLLMKDKTRKMNRIGI